MATFRCVSIILVFAYLTKSIITAPIVKNQGCINKCYGVYGGMCKDQAPDKKDFEACLKNLEECVKGCQQKKVYLIVKKRKHSGVQISFNLKAWNYGYALYSYLPV